MNETIKISDRVSAAIARAIEFDRRGDVVLRSQTIRDMYDLPVTVNYVRKALKTAGLPTR